MLLEFHSDIFLVFIALLCSIVFVTYDSKMKRDPIGGFYKTNPLGQILSFLIWIAVIYLEFHHLKWWLAIIDLIILFAITSIVALKVSKLFSPNNTFSISMVGMVLSLVLLLIIIF